MADEAQTTPKARRKAQGPRTPKPIFAVVTYTGEDGTPVALNKAGINIRLERDAAVLLDMVTSEGFQNAQVVRVELPASATRAKAAA